MQRKKLKIIFAGTDHISLAHLNSLYLSNHNIKTIITKKNVTKYIKKYTNPIVEFSKKKNIPILQSNDLKEEKIYNTLKKIKADILIISSYGVLIPKKIIKLFIKGCINIHPSLLPRWRGSAPIQRAILSGDYETGVSAIKINSKIDAGEIIFQLKCPISKLDTTKTLYTKLIPISLQTMYQALNIVLYQKKIKFLKQKEENATYAKKIKKKETKISWSNHIDDIDRSIRAFNPWPYSYFILEKKIIKIIKASKKPKNIVSNIGKIIKTTKHGIEVSVKSGILNIEIIQISGKKSMHIKDVINSKKEWFKPGRILK